MFYVVTLENFDLYEGKCKLSADWRCQQTAGLILIASLSASKFYYIIWFTVVDPPVISEFLSWFSSWSTIFNRLTHIFNVFIKYFISGSPTISILFCLVLCCCLQNNFYLASLSSFFHFLFFFFCFQL